MLHSYDPNDEEHMCEPTAVNHPFEIRYSQLGAIRKEFVIPDNVQVRAPNVEDRTYIPSNGWMILDRIN